LKSIDVGFGKEESERFHRDFYEWFEDLLGLAESRGIKLTFMHFYGLLCKIIDMINGSKLIHYKKTGYKAPFVRVTFEETENKSAKFTIILLDENKNLLSEEKHCPVLYFLATDEDIKNSPLPVKEIFTLPDKLPPPN